MRESNDLEIKKTIREIEWFSLEVETDFRLKEKTLNQLCIEWALTNKTKVWVYNGGGYTTHRDVEAILSYNCNILYCIYISIANFNKYLTRLGLKYLHIDETKIFPLNKDLYNSDKNPIRKMLGVFFVRDWVLDSYRRFSVLDQILGERPVYKGRLGSPFIQLLYELGLYVYVELYERYKRQQKRTGCQLREDVYLTKEEFLQLFIQVYYLDMKKIDIYSKSRLERERDKHKLYNCVRELSRLGGTIVIPPQIGDIMRFTEGKVVYRGENDPLREREESIVERVFVESVGYKDALTSDIFK